MIPSALRRRWLVTLAAVVGLATAAGCTATVDGHGTFAQGGGSDDGGDGGDGGGGGNQVGTLPPPNNPPPSQDGGGDDDGGGGPSGGGGGGQSGGDVSRDSDAADSPVCQLFDDDQLVDLFGGPVDLTVPHSDASCEFTVRGTTDYIDLSVYLDEDAHYIMLDGATPITIAGHPGLEDSITISVSLTDDIDATGCLQGDNWFGFETDDQGREISKTLVEAAIGEFEIG